MLIYNLRLMNHVACFFAKTINQFNLRVIIGRAWTGSSVFLNSWSTSKFILCRVLSDVIFISKEVYSVAGDLRKTRRWGSFPWVSKLCKCSSFHFKLFIILTVDVDTHVNAQAKKCLYNVYM